MGLLLDAAAPLLLVAVGYVVYNLAFHPLTGLPGPFWARISPLWLWYHSYIGDEASTIHRMHGVYGLVVRVAPNEVDISDGAALAPIYTERGGFLKSPCYRNFDIDGHQSIFSALDPAHRAPRAKAIAGMFATAAIRRDGGEEVIEGCVGKLVEYMQIARKDTGVTLNLLDLTRRLAVDSVTGYLFGKAYGGLDELQMSTDGTKTGALSANAFVDAFVAVGRFFLLPNWLFVPIESATIRAFSDRQTEHSMSLVSAFTDALAAEASSDEPTYQGRLLGAGLSRAEVSAQCKDLIFAGTDSTGMNVATICWYLTRPDQQDTYTQLRAELLANPDAPLDGLPLLRAVVKEGLRVSMANPTRLPRAVPSGGWSFRGTHFPAGTNVGCAAYSLHFDEAVFPDARSFRAQRWLDGNVTPEMARDAIPFGLGPRQCIARNLAMAELHIAVRRIVEADVLRGAVACGRCRDGIEIDEWFNSKVIGHAIELRWPEGLVKKVTKYT